MGSINLRIDDELKARSYAALEKMGVTPSEALRLESMKNLGAAIE